MRDTERTVAIVLVAAFVLALALLVAVELSHEETPLPPGCASYTEFSHYQYIPVYNGKTTTTIMQPVYDTEIICTTPEA